MVSVPSGRRTAHPRAPVHHPDGMGGDDLASRRAWIAAAAVLDPEVPCVTVADLGILRSVEVEGGVATARLTPTYSGCPAVLAIELAVETPVNLTSRQKELLREFQELSSENNPESSSFFSSVKSFWDSMKG